MPYQSMKIVILDDEGAYVRDAAVGKIGAVPKEVIITPEIPLTPVGKIFKPALRWDATKRVYERATSGHPER